MIRYFDTSALIKRYVRETGTEDVERWVGEAVATARLTTVELSSALYRRVRTGDLERHEADGQRARAFAHLATSTVVDLTPDVVSRAAELLSRHPLRAGDAIHLASALRLGQTLAEPLPFVCYDDRLRAAAAAEGLPVLPPAAPGEGAAQATGR